tara:strand:- start:31 stop:471 length:441 start_codon:yes stop_codon:yes gene_type:complete
MNRVSISGSEEDIKKITKLVSTKESALSFDNIIPTPNWKEIPNEKGELPVKKEIKNDEGEVIRTTNNFPDGTNDSRGYNWQIENWGTKWDASCVEVVSEGTDYIEYEFATAWSPPEPIIDKLREDFPDISISAFYDEPGNQIAGYY